ncbi:Kelch repeat-containing protein [Spirosoma gilvum]
MNRLSTLLSTPMTGVSGLILALALIGVVSCSRTDDIPIILADESSIIPPTLVSVQPMASDRAEIIVKSGFEFNPPDWQLTIVDTTGKPVSVQAASVSRLDLFNLMPYQATGLVAGRTYRLRFSTKNAGGDSISVQRSYRHNPGQSYWARLAHAPVDGGDFAGSALSTANIPGADNSQVSIWQLKRDDTWQTLSYTAGIDSWYAFKFTYDYRASHGLVRFRLQAAKGVEYTMSGLGFVVNELLPGQRQYLKDMVIPDFAGPDGEVRWFAVLDRAYQLVEGGPSQVWVRMGTWDQYRAPDLPEPTGTLATFRIGTTGYVINQRPQQAAHVWAFDTKTEQWSRKANFPGAIRSRGIGFQRNDKGYFGLGISPNDETLRDVWLYDPGSDQWRYVTDYPGAASTYLVVSEVPGHTYLGWGYEHQATLAGGIRLVGCTDFWEFKGN